MEILGIHFDRPYVQCAAVETKRSHSAIQSLKSFSPDDVKPLYIQEWKKPIATGLSALVRHLDFKLSSIKQIELGLPFQIETLTHMNLEELTYAAQISLNDTGAQSTIFLATKESLKNLLKKCSDLSVEPDLVTGYPEALVRFSQFKYPALHSAFIVHLGSQEWTCVWMEKGKLKKSFTIQDGIESLLTALWEDRKKILLPKEVKGVAKQIDLLQLKPYLNPKLSEQLIALRNTLSSVFHSFQQPDGVKPVLFTGRADAFGNLSNYLLEINTDLSQYEGQLSLNFEESKCAIAIGFALAGSVKNSAKIPFLREEFVTKKTWRKAGRWGLSLMFASLFLSAALIYFGERYFFNIRKKMAIVLKKTIEETDKNLGTILFADGIDEGMSQAFQIIEKYDIESPYLISSPTVSEVISWISSHPLLEVLQTTKDPLEIIDLSYHLISFPRIGAMKDPYLAKVELEFRIKNPTIARKFHEALLQGDALVDPHKDITWESLSNSYRTSFYLKNRQPYVR